MQRYAKCILLCFTIFTSNNIPQSFRARMLHPFALGSLRFLLEVVQLALDIGVFHLTSVNKCQQCGDQA